MTSQMARTVRRTDDRPGPWRGLLVVGAVGATALLAAACGSSSSSGTTSSTSSPPTTHGSAYPTPTSSTAVAPTTGGATTGGVVVSASSRGSVGVVLTDGADGPTLYRYTPDGTGPSTCTGACAQAWPPLTVPSASSVTAGSGVPAADLGTSTRPGGGLQVTYKGMPLYRYAGDSQASSTSGQGVGGIWFVVHPADPAQPTTSGTATSKVWGT